MDNRSGSVLAAVVFKHRFNHSTAPLPLQVSAVGPQGQRGLGAAPWHLAAAAPGTCPEIAPLWLVCDVDVLPAGGL